MFDLPWPDGSLPTYFPGAGYEAPIYDIQGNKHLPYEPGWYATLEECRSVVFDERWNNAGRIQPGRRLSRFVPLFFVRRFNLLFRHRQT